MWRRVYGDDRQSFLAKAIEFTGDAVLYGEWMIRATEQWPISCSQNLSFSGQNRQAWIGHAACCLAVKCPEDITREAWWHLTDEQRTLAKRGSRPGYPYVGTPGQGSWSTGVVWLCRSDASV